MDTDTLADPASVQFVKALSRLLGWIYFLAWSVSFYPQPLLNLQRRSTKGALIDYPAINFLGFTFLFLSTTLFYAHPAIRAQYAARNPQFPEPTVQPNDVAFAAHAWVLTAITITQYWPWLWGFAQKKGQRPRGYVTATAIGCIVGVMWITILVGTRGGNDSSTWAWIDVVYAMGYCKLVITVVKYCPQVWANYQRKSTVGWSINQVLLDLIGGVLSIAQLLIDSSLQGDWSGVTGNPVKFGLGNVSIVFDLIFITQHYVLYAHARAEGAEGRGLLAPDNRDD